MKDIVMSPHINPYIAGNPVTAPEMFFGREDVFSFIQQNLMGQHRDSVIVLYGQQPTDTTSVLSQMRHRLDTARYLCVFTDLHGFALDGLGGFLWDLAKNITRVLHRDYQIGLPDLNRSEFMTDPRHSFEVEFLNQVWLAIGKRHILLMLDEAARLQEQVQAGKLEQGIFEYMRHLMQHYEQLNFLFSLGSSLEEMEKEYTFLFNVGLYKKISFLHKDAASALITLPIKSLYRVTPPTLERIFQVTSGHPYYTQLLCHCLFNCWQQQHTSEIEIKHVEEVLDEVIELGHAVLKQAWEESSSGEKAVMAAMAAVMSEQNGHIGIESLSQIWKSRDVDIPKGEITRSVQSLTSREIIAGLHEYIFTVDLQRLWVRKHKRLEGVKEEIAAAIREWASHSTKEGSYHIENIFASIANGAITINSSGIITAFNEVAGLILNQKPIESVGKHYQEVFKTVPQLEQIGQLRNILIQHENGTVVLHSATCEIPSHGLINLNFNDFSSQDVEDTSTAIAQVVDDHHERKLSDVETKQIRRLFEGYVHPHVIQQLIRDPAVLDLGGETKEISVVFADIRGYTSLSERMAPEDVMNLINRYLQIMCEAIWEEEGTITAFQGAALMAIFNAPLQQKNHALRAVRSAWKMREAVELYQHSQPEEIIVRYGISVNTGLATVGNVGSQGRLQNYTAIGDVVNVASRLRDAATDNNIYLNDSTYIQVYRHVKVSQAFPLQVKNKAAPLTVHRLMGMAPSAQL